MRPVHVPLMAFAVCATAAFAQPPARAYVLSASGAWVLNGNTSQAVRAGASLHEGDRVGLSRAPRKSDAIVIISRRTAEVLVKRDCSRDDCKKTIIIHDDEAPGIVRRVLDLVMTRWAEDGDAAYTSVASRNTPGLFEAVVKEHEAEADLRGVVGELPAGEWTLQWQPIGTPERRSPIRMTVIVGGDSVRASLSDVSAGLYQVRAFRAGAPETAAAESEAWVLVARSCRYEDAAAFFDEAVDTASAWAADGSSDSVRKFLRTALAAYASSMAPCP